MIAIPLQPPNQPPKRPARGRRISQEPAQAPQPSGPMHVISEIFATSVKVAVYIPIVAIVVTMLVAFVQRIFFPQCVAVVQEFEVSPTADKQLSMSGKTASNIALDLLNQHVALGSQFHGADYYHYADVPGIQPIALEQSIKIPVQSSYGIEVKGVSIDTLIKLYNRIRNREWTISGDINSIGDQIVVRLRINRDGVAKYWEAPDPKQPGPPERDGAALIRTATEKMLADEHPELLGRSFLQQHEYENAEKVFTDWTLKHPRDWRPSYYLSLAYDSQGKAQEALCLARWSRKVAEDQEVMSKMISRKPATSNTPVPDELAAVTEAVSQMNAIPEKPPATKTEAIQRLSQLDKVKEQLQILFDKSPSNSNYAIHLARSLDRKADLEMNSLGDLRKATDHEKDAIKLLELAIREAPENGGLYEQRSMFLQRLVDLERKQNMNPEEVAKLKEKEINGFRQALELWPSKISSPLWGAVYGLINRNDQNDKQGAIDLAQAVMLLRPESTTALRPESITAKVAYTVALAHAGRTEEAKKNLPHLLEAAEQSELEALRRGFQIAGDSTSQSQIEEVQKMRFPQSSLPQEQRQAERSDAPAPKPSAPSLLQSSTQPPTGGRS